jgi:hypothetical protein
LTHTLGLEKISLGCVAKLSQHEPNWAVFINCVDGLAWFPLPIFICLELQLWVSKLRSLAWNLCLGTLALELANLSFESLALNH